MNLKQLRRARLARPTTYVDAPELAAWGVFAEGEAQRVKIRGLTSQEIFLAKEQISKGSPLMKLALAANGNGAENGQVVAEALQHLLGTDLKAIPYEIRWRQELLVKAAIDEEGLLIFDHQIAALLSEHFPDLFIRLTEATLRISGEASTDLGEKLRRSGETSPLEIPSSTQSAEENFSTNADPISSPTTVSRD